jgi:hypothetical protein
LIGIFEIQRIVAYSVHAIYILSVKSTRFSLFSLNSGILNINELGEAPDLFICSLDYQYSSSICYLFIAELNWFFISFKRYLFSKTIEYRVIFMRDENDEDLFSSYKNNSNSVVYLPPFSILSPFVSKKVYI